jgi:hypothetical protein
VTPKEAYWLLAHTNKDERTGIAQATVKAFGEKHARELFIRDHPHRVVTKVGVKGMS